MKKNPIVSKILTRNGNAVSTSQPSSSDILTRIQSLESQLDGLEQDNELFPFVPPQYLQITTSIRDLLSQLLIVDLNVAIKDEVDVSLWKKCLYKIVEQFRPRLSELIKTGKGRQAQEILKLFATYVKDSLTFLVDLMHRFCRLYGLSKAARVLKLNVEEKSDEFRANLVIYRLLIYQGDLNRYKIQFATKPSTDFSLAMKCYRQAQELLPNVGTAYNQLAVVHQSQQRDDKALQYYLRAIVCKDEFVTARNNIRGMCKAWQKKKLVLTNRPSGFYLAQNSESFAGKILTGLMESVWGEDLNLENLKNFSVFMLPLEKSCVGVLTSYSIILSLFHLAHRRRRDIDGLYEPALVKKSDKHLRETLLKIAFEWTFRILSIYSEGDLSEEMLVTRHVSIAWLNRILSSPERFIVPESERRVLKDILSLVTKIDKFELGNMTEWQGFAAIEDVGSFKSLLDVVIKTGINLGLIQALKDPVISKRPPSQISTQILVPEDEIIVFKGKWNQAKPKENRQDSQSEPLQLVDTMSFLGLDKDDDVNLDRYLANSASQGFTSLWPRNSSPWL